MNLPRLLGAPLGGPLLLYPSRGGGPPRLLLSLSKRLGSSLGPSPRLLDPSLGGPPKLREPPSLGGPPLPLGFLESYPRESPLLSRSELLPRSRGR
uniref:Uncharacterized protein n=1 Tax=Lepeophtheirus salmonis TaxID=72036 RepID=A0A0K2UDS3_LEPSM